jgi:hypothetical protein
MNNAHQFIKTVKRYEYDMGVSYFRLTDINAIFCVYDHISKEKFGYQFSYSSVTGILAVWGNIKYADVVCVDDILKVRNMKISNIMKRIKS